MGDLAGGGASLKLTVRRNFLTLHILCSSVVALHCQLQTGSFETELKLSIKVKNKPKKQVLSNPWMEDRLKIESNL